jgi:hypothetical protein
VSASPDVMPRPMHARPGLEATAFLRGAIAGAAATAPMTAFMLAAFRFLPRREQYPLPPREITDEVRERSGLFANAREPAALVTTLASHFAYGTAAGTLLGGVRSSSTGAAAGRGALYGLGVWLASYLGLLPALRLLKPATEHPKRRSALMILAHVLWGGCAGALAHILEATRSQSPMSASRARATYR